MPSLPPLSNNPDIVYLGKLLGDVIRADGGEALYEHTEAIRAASVARHRDGRRRRAAARRPRPRPDARLRARVRAVHAVRQPRRGPAGRDRGRRDQLRDRAGTGRPHRRARPARPRADRAGADRAPDRSPAQVGARPPRPHRRAAGAEGRRRRPKPPTANRSRKRSSARSRCCGRPARSAPASRASPTRSRPRSPICATVSCPRCPRSTNAGTAPPGSACRASCGPATGSAATATAIRS